MGIAAFQHSAQRESSSLQLEGHEQAGRGNTERLQDGGQVQQQGDECDEISFVKKNIHELARIINTDFGLLRALVGSCCRGSYAYHFVNDKRTNDDKARTVLEIVYRVSHEWNYDVWNLVGSECEVHESVMLQLDHRGHKHVSNFIRGKGQRAAEYGDDWPLRWCDEEELRFQDNRSKLVELMDSRNGLLDEMLTVGCINHEIRQHVDHCGTDTDKNDRLLAIIRRGSLADYNKFISCLLRTNQHQVVSLIAPSLVGDIRSLSDGQQTRLIKKYATLVREIDLKYGLINELFAAECITQLQLEYIESATTPTDKCKRLIDIVRRGSEAGFCQFIQCLNKTDQEHVSRILVND